MKNIKKAALVSVLLPALISCSNNKHDQITGVYAREHSWKQKNIDTEKEIGTATVRDTIFITETKGGYKVENVRWRKNEYDTKGWVNHAHAQIRPMPTFIADFNDQDHSLVPKEGLPGKIIYLDVSTKELYLLKDSGVKWSKVAHQ